MHPTLALFDTPPVPYRDRVVADASDRVSWLRERSRGVTATDVARLSGEKAIRAVATDKLLGSSFSGNAYTRHGTEREPEIGRWVARHHAGMSGNTALFHADGNRAHLATPDGIRERGGALELCEIKTTRSAWRTIPRHYLRQVWWQQYVLGAERTLVVWEQHDDFVPVSGVPETRWVERDDDEIHRLVRLADQLLDAMHR
ncbi:YqaJ viral recombinase family protein [Protaetiibacter larvae]|uniref:YqaJ viral recombinase family protein n=1 Tax=Protaetiibacter larvae TaxID=2592654 RepID=UPI001FE50BDF|nr:YqaJ viral recombinase family protein [Protaetiibacter larvae]